MDTRVLENNVRMEEELTSVLHDIEYIKKNCYNQGVASYHNKILEKLNPLSIITKKLIRQSEKENYIRMSLIPIMREFLLNKLHHLAQIEFEYNPFDRTLITFSNGAKITTVISHCIKYDSLTEMYQYLMYQELQDNPEKVAVALEYLQPVLNHSIEVAKYYTFTVDQKFMEEILWNYDIYQLAGTEEEFIKEQNEIISEELKKFASTRITNAKKITFDFKRIIGENLLKRKKINVEKNYFFAEPEEYESDIYDTINNAFEEQIQLISDMDVEEPRLKKSTEQELEKEKSEIVKQSKLSSIIEERESGIKLEKMSKYSRGNISSHLFKEIAKNNWSGLKSKVSKITETQ